MNRFSNLNDDLKKIMTKSLLVSNITNNDPKIKKLYQILIDKFLTNNKLKNTVTECIQSFKTYYPSQLKNVLNSLPEWNELNTLSEDFQKDIFNKINEYINNDLNKYKDSTFIKSLSNNNLQDNSEQRLTEVLEKWPNHIDTILTILVKTFSKNYGNPTLSKFKQYLKTTDAKSLIINEFNNIMTQISQPFDINDTTIRKKIYTKIVQKILNNVSLPIYFKARVSTKNNFYEAIVSNSYINNFDQVFKVPLSAYTPLGKKLIQEIYKLFKPEFDSFDLEDKYRCIMSNYMNADFVMDEIALDITSHIQNINSSWERRKIHNFIINVLYNIIIPKLSKEINSQEIIDKIIKVIKKHISDIIPYVKDKFPKHKNGYYDYTWLDSGQGMRWEANLILEYISKNQNLAATYIQEALNINLKQFEELIMPWDRFIQLMIDQSTTFDSLHLAVRKYLVRFNQDINIQKSNDIAKQSDNDQIARFNELGNLVIPDNIQSIKLDFDPRDDAQREKPIVIIREYIYNENESLNKNNYKDHVIVGQRGANHGFILKNKKYQLLLEQSKVDEYTPTIACCYAIGDIAIIDNQRMFFPSVKAVKDALEQSGKFQKVYIYPKNDRVIYRVAKRLCSRIK